MISLFIFRRDLRLQDNTGLIAALRNSEEVIPSFILTPEQLKLNDYRSDNAVQFMFNSLRELDSELKKKRSKLYLYEGKPEKIVERLSNKINAVYVNMDYTPYSNSRDEEIARICKEKNIEFHTFHDCLLTEPNEVLTDSNKPFTIFTPFYKKAKNKNIPYPATNNLENYSKKSYGEKDIEILKKYSTKINESIFRKGGRQEGLNLLNQIKNKISYRKERDIPSIEGTTGLSAHNHFGTISIREFYHKVVDTLGKDHQLISELFWRDFYTHIAFNYPSVFGKELKEKYRKLKWAYDKEKFNAWCKGKTGFPIVDAGMRQLNQTGWMHNRVRMIVASFLTKDLHIDWRWGEKYFAQNLVDYDPAVNNGSWQWAASTGSDAQPYFRIFNPWSQQKKFDPECKYIKRWIPELEKYNSKEIHQWQGDNSYPSPIVDHNIERKKALEMFKEIS